MKALRIDAEKGSNIVQAEYSAKKTSLREKRDVVLIFNNTQYPISYEQTKETFAADMVAEVRRCDSRVKSAEREVKNAQTRLEEEILDLYEFFPNVKPFVDE
ncbi:MAG TPA: hypothetical protein VHQ20_02610 [Patescibacteria group bacterium]|jgi:hypothetical protein|nr:hypothetical protein [Patescibacteria group bacterium]